MANKENCVVSIDYFESDGKCLPVHQPSAKGKHLKLPTKESCMAKKGIVLRLQASETKAESRTRNKNGIKSETFCARDGCMRFTLYIKSQTESHSKLWNNLVCHFLVVAPKHWNTSSVWNRVHLSISTETTKQASTIDILETANISLTKIAIALRALNPSNCKWFKIF